MRGANWSARSCARWDFRNFFYFREILVSSCHNLKARSRWSLLKSIGGSSSSSGKNSKRVSRAAVDGGGGGGWGYFTMSSSSSSTTPAAGRPRSNGGGATEPTYLLDSCIDVIETVGGIDGLTLQQRRAIQNLRSIASEALSLQHRRGSDVRRDNDNHSDWPMGRSFQRREAFVGNKGSSFLSSELSRFIREMEDNREDEDHHPHPFQSPF